MHGIFGEANLNKHWNFYSSLNLLTFNQWFFCFMIRRDEGRREEMTEKVYSHFYTLISGARKKSAIRTMLWSRFGSCRRSCLSCRRTSSPKNRPGTRLRNSRGTWVKSLRPWRLSWRTPSTQLQPSRSLGTVCYISHPYFKEWCI